MKLSLAQLPIHLQRQLHPLYVVSGDETLLVQESVQAIKTKAQDKGFTESLRFTADSGFDWSSFLTAIQSNYLFSDRQYLELRLLTLKISDAGKKILQNYAEQPSATKVVVIVTGKLDASAQKTAWVKALEKNGVMLTIWPLTPQQMLAWLTHRLQTAGFRVDSEATQLLMMRTQGNLLAAAQEIEKLALLYPAGQLTYEQVCAAGSDQARFTVFDLIEPLLQGNGVLLLRILLGLRGEGVEPLVVLWALTRELRQWLALMAAQQAGESVDTVLRSHYGWEKRKPALLRVLQRHTLSTLQQCLRQAAGIDRLAKGAASGSVWDELTSLVLAMAGMVKAPFLQMSRSPASGR